MLRVILSAAIIAVLASACSSPAPAPAPAPRTTAVPRATPASPTAAPARTFTAEDAALVRAYYSGQAGNRGNGRGRNGGLPPGIEKNLARGKSLPPGIAKQYLPSDLLVQLPPAPRGLEYAIVAGKLLLVEVATQVVREILLEAVFG